MKKSNLPKEALKQIWYISAQTDPNQLERDEFYIALRLVALAQNNIPITIETIKNNTPIPPLPVFNLKKDASSTQVEDIESAFALNDSDIQKYTRFFNTSKEYDNKLSIQKACQMWKSTNVNDETISKIFLIVNPLKENGFVNLKEFIVCTLFVFKSFNKEIPKVLPQTLSTYLYGDYKKDIPLINQLSSNQQIQNPNPHLHLQPVIEQGQPQLSIQSKGQVLSSLNQMENPQGFPLINQSNQQANVQSLQNIQALQEVFNQTEQDLLLITGLVQEIEKKTKGIEKTKEKNKTLKQQIKEAYEKIKAMKSSLIKQTLMIPQKNNEIDIAQEELNKIKTAYFSTMDEKGQLEIEYVKEKERVTKSREDNQYLNPQKEKEEESKQNENNFIQIQEKRNQIMNPIDIQPSNNKQNEMQYGRNMDTIEVSNKQRDNIDPYLLDNLQLSTQERQMNNPLIYQNQQGNFDIGANYLKNNDRNDILKENVVFSDPSMKSQPTFAFNDKQINQENNYGFQNNQFDQIQNQDLMISSISKISYPSFDTITRFENAKLNNNPFQPSSTNNNTNTKFGFGDEFGKYNANYEERKIDQKDDWDF